MIHMSKYVADKEKMNDYVKSIGKSPADYANYDMAVRELTDITEKDHYANADLGSILDFWNTVELPDYRKYRNADDIYVVLWHVSKYGLCDRNEWCKSYVGKQSRDAIEDIKCFIHLMRAEAYEGWGNYTIELNVDFNTLWSYSTEGEF